VSDRGRLYAWLAFVGAFAALNYGARFSGDQPDRSVLYTYSAAVLGFVQLVLILGIMLLITRGRPKREYLAMRRPRSWPRAAGLAVLVLVGVFMLAGILQPFLDPGHEQGLVPERWRPENATAFALNFAVVALAAPVVEELTFRGIGFRLLLPFGQITAIVLVGIFFALAHGLVEALPILAAFGSGLAFLRARTESVYPGMLVHAAFNSLVLALAVTT
jgi:membrane protease YdiL (CAAX protease family)